MRGPAHALRPAVACALAGAWAAAAWAAAACAPGRPAARPAAPSVGQAALEQAALADPRHPLWRAPAPAVFRVRVETTQGAFVVEARRAWAPRGADRFYGLARAGFFDDSRFFRVRAGFIAQFGIPGDPAVAAAWRAAEMPDDPVRQSNTRGTVSYAMTGPNTRTTQLFVNLADNGRLDAEGFAPLGVVVEGMDVVDRLHAGYGEAAGGGMRGGQQAPLFAGGNAYLDRAYPRLDRLRSARVVGPPAPAHDTLTVTSRALGEARRVNVHTPAAYAAPAASRARRFPVLYMPDGGIDEDFPRVVATVDSLVALGRIRPVIVVGVPNTERRRDLTGPTRVARDSAIAPRVGGSAAFRRFLCDELVPAIDRRYRTTAERAIVGESLAGLFVVETFLTEPALFDRYVALDPSLWWNGGALADSAAARLAALDLRGRTLFVSSSRDDVDDRTARLVAALRAARPPGLRWTYVPRPDLTHATIFRAAGPDALARALR